ncbi:LPXTG cell wall anchor domain-containing protein, partial [Streptococcus merionis]
VEKYHNQLPKTGTATTAVLEMIGLGLSTVGLVGYRKQRKSRYSK